LYFIFIYLISFKLILLINTGADVLVAQALASLPRLKSLILGVKLVNDDFMETLSQYKNPFANVTKLYLGGIKESEREQARE
jgi:hypothetical protein